jgi:uncharacterized protein (TIGR00255 family)
MTGYGRGESASNGTKFSVEVNSVNRKQSDVTVNLPRELSDLEPRIRDMINKRISRGRMNVAVAYHRSNASSKAVIDKTLARAYFKAMKDLRDDLQIGGELSIDTLLRAPGVLRLPENEISSTDSWVDVKKALGIALDELVEMREREGKHLAKDLIKRLKVVRASLRKIKKLHPEVASKYRLSLQERIRLAGIDLQIDDERLTREVIFFAEKSDISEELIRLDSHLAQFAHLLRKIEPVGRTLDFVVQEIYREFNTLGSKANDAEISQLVVTCKAEMEKIREQIQNIE